MKTSRAEIIALSILLGSVTAFYIYAGLMFLFGPVENRLAREASTIVPALIWAVVTWVFICVICALLCHAIFTIARFIMNRNEN